jgi:hypothetical protein
MAAAIDRETPKGKQNHVAAHNARQQHTPDASVLHPK